MDRERGLAPFRAALTGNGRTTRNDGQLRQLVLGGAVIDYRLYRARRRSIGMLIDLSGLSVRAPRWVGIGDIEAALRERTAWILRTLEEWRNRRREVLPREWKSGAPILYQGAELALAVFPSRRRDVVADLFHVTVRHPTPHDESLLASFVRHWLRDETLRLLHPHVARHAGTLGCGVPAVRLSNARREWGSCNHRGVIRLNSRLVHLPPRLAQYVVAHEMAHLIELNHSSRFWAVVEALFPGHASARRELGEWTALLEV
ncbi:MAG: M48 family metallopeptidase [Pseudomonadota bacterium]|nr:M48 family metallopeptidase [Pseudomonadota bacterium]